jgi:hypothetical protein
MYFKPTKIIAPFFFFQQHFPSWKRCHEGAVKNKMRDIAFFILSFQTLIFVVYRSCFFVTAQATEQCKNM